MVIRSVSKGEYSEWDKALTNMLILAGAVPPNTGFASECAAADYHGDGLVGRE